MMYLVSILIISLISSQAISLQIEDVERLPIRNLNDKLRQFLEVKLREMMRNGNDDIKLPILDPLQGSGQEFNYTLDEINIFGKVNDYYVTQLSNYLVKEASLNVFQKKIIVGMHFTTIQADGNYELGKQYVGIYGDGDYHVTARNFSFTATIILQISPEVQVTSIDLKIHLGELQAIFTGIFNDDEVSSILNPVISDMVPTLIDRYHDKITAHISAKAIAEANKQLKGKSWKDLLGMIS